MNYRHAYHAGNFADVLKHTVFALAIAHLKKKEAPFRVVDTHAGRGWYALDAPEALKTREWQGGIGRLIGSNAAPLPRDVAEVMEPYLEAVRALNAEGRLSSYPGSPLVASALMRSRDRLVASELHPEDVMQLKNALGRDRRAKVLSIDGWTALKSLLPPKERRGVILVDPPFEADDEFDRLAEGLEEGLQRFANGVFIAWFPIKDPAATGPLLRRVRQLEVPSALHVELFLGDAPNRDDRLRSCGLIIVNPPYPLEAQLGLVLPELVRRMREGRSACFRLKAL
jgi:23S rRNA (adenine2030-N6)-methyltransferase